MPKKTTSGYCKFNNTVSISNFKIFLSSKVENFKNYTLGSLSKTSKETLSILLVNVTTPLPE
jgi:hypothetical protein